MPSRFLTDRGLEPVPQVTELALADGKRALIWDAAWASVTGAWSGGVVLVAFALSLGADPITIGFLGAIPFLAQAVQLPTVLLVERVRRRKLIGVTTLTVARLIIFLLALLPFLASSASRVSLLIAAQSAIAILGSVAACANNSWFHQLLPAAGLGEFFGQRLLAGCLIGCGGTLAAGFLVDHPPLGQAQYAYAISFLCAGIAGLASSAFLARTPEPQMKAPTYTVSMSGIVWEPLRDANFRSLLIMLSSWNLASNLAAPFIAVYLIQQLSYGLGTVTTLWVASQVANAAALYLWGRLSDRLSNKAVLAVSLPAYFLCMFGFVFAGSGGVAELQLSMLYLLHAVMGMASGGISLATGNLGLKLAPQGRGTAYLAVIGLVSAIAGGIAPMAGGAIAQWLSSSNLAMVVRWTSPSVSHEVSVLSFAHWEFLFAISSAMGLYVLRALSRIREGSEISERVVIQELALEALRTVNHLSSIGGVLGSAFSFRQGSHHRD